MIARKMTEDDIKYVADIEKSSFSMPWTFNGFMDALKNPDAMLTVVEEDGEIVGYTCMYCSFEEGEITNVAVKESKRGQGIGKYLMSETMKFSLERGIQRIILEVRCSNENAIGLYNKIGFNNVGVRKGFYEKPKEDACIMICENIRKMEE